NALRTLSRRSSSRSARSTYGRAWPVLSSSLSVVLAMRAPVLSVVGRANLPRRAPGKRLLATGAAAMLACAGCGGAGPKPRVVRGEGFRFDAPADWQVARRGQTLEAAAPVGPELLWVTRMRLLRP